MSVARSFLPALRIKVRSYRTAAVVSAYVGLSALFCSPLFEFPHGLGVYDWDQHLFYYGSVLKSVVEYGQLPFWNPWYCGGGILWQNPQIALLSPVYPLAVILPLPLAMKVNVFLHYCIGFAGMHALLTRAMGVSFLPGVVYLASLFTLSGGPAIHLLAGHSNFLPIFYLPFMLFFAHRAISDRQLRDAALAAVPPALAILNGGPHVVPIALVAIGTLGAVASAARREWRPAVVGAAIAVGAMALAAPKIVPAVLFVDSAHFQDGRNVGVHPDAMTPEMLTRAYLDPFQHPGLRVGTVRHGWWEYGNYIGSFAALLTIASILFIALNRHLPEWWLGISLAFTIVVLVIMSAGEFSRFAPYVLLKKLPFFASFNVPSRYTLVVPLFAAATVAWVARALQSELPASYRLRLFVAVVCVLATTDLLVRNRSQFNKVFSLEPLAARFIPLQGVTEVVVDATTDSQAPSRSPMYRALMDSRPLYHCHEGVQVKRTAAPTQPLVVGGPGVKVFDVAFSPNRIDFGVTVGTAESRAVLNQNFADGWSSTAGRVVPDPDSGRPSVVLAPGTAGQFAFRFIPPGLWSGLAICMVAIAGAAWGWKRRA